MKLKLCMLLPCHVRVLPHSTVCLSKQEPYLKFKWQQRDSNPQGLSL